MPLDRLRRSLAAAAPLAAVFLLTGAINVSCAGDPLDSTGTGGSTRPNSHAMGQWTPVSGVDTCTQAEHDEHFVIGPDGKKYPTWHAATRLRSDGTTCSYGHEHGRDPAGSLISAEIKRHFGYDADGNGVLDQSELDASGVPFGYVAEQLDVYNAAGGTAPAQGQRHQPHTAYKIVYDTVLRRRIVGGVAQNYDLFCNHLVALNQDTATADAFASNMHEAIVAIDCNAGTKASEYPVRLIVSGMMNFGNANVFDASALSSTTPQPITPPGQTAVPTNSATNVTTGRRAIPGAVGGVNRMWDNAFVAANATSILEESIAERWAAEFLLQGNGTTYATLRPTVTALAPSRFYDPAGVGLAGRTVDLCYTGLNAGGSLVSNPALSGTIARQVRGLNECSVLGTEAGRLSLAVTNRVKYDAAASPFRNCRREVLFGNVTVANGGRDTVQYSDPFGLDTQPARTDRRPVKQYVAAVNTATLVAGGIELEAVKFGRDVDTCASSVHVPN